MCDPLLLAATESERLTIEQEYANQVSWEVDPNKYCFIIHSRRPVITTFQNSVGVRTILGVDYTLDSEAHAEEMRKSVHLDQYEEDVATISESLAVCAIEASAASSPSPAQIYSAVPAASPNPEPTSALDDVGAPASPSSSSDPYPLTPIGDVNLFLHEDFNLSDFGVHGGGCEIEIMIGESRYLRRGLASEALRLLMAFSAEKLGVQRFVVKILASNTASIALFEKMNFRLIEYVECFEEMVYFCDMSLIEEDVGEEGELPDEEESAATTTQEESATMQTTSHATHAHTNEHDGTELTVNERREASHTPSTDR
jgi:RimJ/RimL family protein N-acetyltransferase